MSTTSTTIRATISAPLAFGNREAVIIAQGGAVNLFTGDYGGLHISGVISGSNGLTKAGSGVLALSGANTYTGQTTLSSGTTLLLGDVAGDGSPSLFGTSTTPIVLTSGNGPTALYASGGVDRIINRDLLIIGGGCVPVTLGGHSSEALTVNGNITLIDPNNSGSFVMNAQGQVTLNGVISGNGRLGHGMFSTLILNGNKTKAGVGM